MLYKKAFSLIETLLCLLLTAMLLSLFYSAFFSYQNFYIYQKSHRESLENAMFASLFIQKLFMMAGYAGCVNLENRVFISTQKNEKKSLHLESIILDPIGLKTKHNVLQDTSVVFFRFMDPNVGHLSSKMEEQHSICVPHTLHAKKNMYFMISDCYKNNIFKISNVIVKNNIDCLMTEETLFWYGKDSLVGQWHESLLYVAETERRDQKGEKIKALYFEDPDAEELVSGIDTLKIKGKAPLWKIFFYANGITNTTLGQPSQIPVHFSVFSYAYSKSV